MIWINDSSTRSSFYQYIILIIFIISIYIHTITGVVVLSAASSNLLPMKGYICLDRTIIFSHCLVRSLVFVYLVVSLWTVSSLVFVYLAVSLWTVSRRVFFYLAVSLWTVSRRVVVYLTVSLWTVRRRLQGKQQLTFVPDRGSKFSFYWDKYIPSEGSSRIYQLTKQQLQL